MFPLFAITILEQTTGSFGFGSSFFSRSPDLILFDLFIWFGWIPIVITIFWGITEIWLDDRQAKFAASIKYTLLAVDVPSMTEQTPKALEHLFSNLYATRSVPTWKEKWLMGKLYPVFSFEIVSNDGYIRFIIRTRSNFRDIVESGIYAHYPDAEISEIEDYSTKLPSTFPNDEYDMWGTEFTLDKPSYYPIRTYVDFEDQMTGEIKDPLGFTLEQMGKMRPGEHFWFQMLIQPSSHDWQALGIKHINKMYGVEEKSKPAGFLATTLKTTAQFPLAVISHATDIDLSHIIGGHAPVKEEDQWKAFKISPHQMDEAKAILRKSVKIGHGVKIRVLYIAKKNVYSKGERAPMIKGILSQYSHLNLNKFGMFIPQLPKDDYFWQRWEYAKKQTTLMKAYQSRSWGIGANPTFLNTEELASLWHFPAIGVKAPLIKKSEARRGEPPVGLPMTLLENTLPGFVEDTDNEINSFSTENINDFNEEVSREPLPETLPNVISPTDRIESKESSSYFPKTEIPTEDELPPPNLPV